MIALPTFKQIQYFLALETTGSFSKAAEQCHVTQSTLSAAIQELEQILRLTLVDRSRRQITLTAEGALLLPQFSDLILQCESISLYAGRLARPDGGIIRLGTIPTIAPYLLPKILPILRQSLPDYELQIQEDLSENLMSLLEKRQIDIALIAFPYPVKGFETDVIYDEPFYLVGPYKELKDIDNISIDDISEYPLLLMEDGHCLRDHAMQACRIMSRRSDQSLKINSLSTLVQLSAQGYGYSILPQMCVQSSLVESLPLKAVPISSNNSTRGIGLVWRKGTIQNTPLCAIKDAILSISS